MTIHTKQIRIWFTAAYIPELKLQSCKLWTLPKKESVLALAFSIRHKEFVQQFSTIGKPRVVYLVLGLGLTVSSGNFLKRSPKWSIGAVINPTTVSNGGFAGALGWLRLGTKAFVRPKDFAIDWLSSLWSSPSSAGRSSSSSSLICWFRSFMRESRVDTNSGCSGFNFWNLCRASLTYRPLVLIPVPVRVSNQTYRLMFLAILVGHSLTFVSEILFEGGINDQLFSNWVAS